MSGITAFPNPGYEFDHWDSDLFGFNPYSSKIGLYADDGYLTANFSYVGPPPPEFSNVTVSASGQGAADPAVGSYPSTWHVGDDLTVSATAEPGWRYDRMLRNGAEHTSANPGEFLDLRETELIEVVFVPEVPPPPPGDNTALAAGLVACLALLAGGLFAARHFGYI